MKWVSLVLAIDANYYYYTPRGEHLDSKGRPDRCRGVVLEEGRNYRVRFANGLETVCRLGGEAVTPLTATRLPYPTATRWFLIREEFGCEWRTPVNGNLEIFLTEEELNEKGRNR